MLGLDLGALPLWAHLVVTAAAAAGVWYGGSRLAYFGDGVAERTGWSHALVGMLLLAGLTELPELVTTVAAGLAGNPSMAAGNLFGGVALQTAILVVADLRLARGPLTFFTPAPELILQGLMLVLLLALSLSCVLVGERWTLLSVGAWSALLFGAYVLSVAALRAYDASWRPIDVPDELQAGGASAPARHDERSLRGLVLGLLGAGAVVVATGAFTAHSAEAIAERTGLGSSFVGATLVAGTTSLPELSTTLGAVRLGAYRMAVANIFGSNAIMIALILPVDVAYRGGSLLDAVDAPARFSAVAGISVTAVYLIGLVERRDRSFLRLGVDSWIVLALYAGYLAGLYALTQPS